MQPYPACQGTEQCLLSLCSGRLNSSRTSFLSTSFRSTLDATPTTPAGAAPRLSCDQAISGTRRCATANSKSHTSSTSALTSWLPVALILSNWSLFDYPDVVLCSIPSILWQSFVGVGWSCSQRVGPAQAWLNWSRGLRFEAAGGVTPGITRSSTRSTAHVPPRRSWPHPS